MRSFAAAGTGQFFLLLPPGGVTFASSGGVQRSVQRERACAPSPFGNSLPVGWAIIKSRPSRRRSGGWGRCGALRRENSIYSSLSVTAVEEETPTVARGSGSEATAESCGGTVLLADDGTRERRLREEVRNKFAAGRGALRESKTVGFGGVLSHLSFAIERKVTAGGNTQKGVPRLRARGRGDGFPRQSADWLGMTTLCLSEVRGERIATPVCGLVRNDSNSGGGLQGRGFRDGDGGTDCHASVSTGVAMTGALGRVAMTGTSGVVRNDGSGAGKDRREAGRVKVRRRGVGRILDSPCGQRH